MPLGGYRHPCPGMDERRTGNETVDEQHDVTITSAP
jgi:hypothetical protein